MLLLLLKCIQVTSAHQSKVVSFLRKYMRHQKNCFLCPSLTLRCLKLFIFHFASFFFFSVLAHSGAKSCLATHFKHPYPLLDVDSSVYTAASVSPKQRQERGKHFKKVKSPPLKCPVSQGGLIRVLRSFSSSNFFSSSHHLLSSPDLFSLFLYSTFCGVLIFFLTNECVNKCTKKQLTNTSQHTLTNQ